MNYIDYIKPSYTFKEVCELQKLPLPVKIEISVEVMISPNGQLSMI